MKLNLKIDGMGCEHCVKSVREALEEIKGIKVLDVKIGSAEIEAENDSVLNEIREKLDDVGLLFRKELRWSKWEIIKKMNVKN